VSDAPPATRRLRRLGETCLWLLVIGAAVIALAIVFARLRIVVLPLLLAVVLATFLAPPTAALQRRMHDGVAALIMVFGFVAALVLTFGLLAPRVLDEFRELDVSISGGLDEVQRWLTDGPLNLSESQIEDLFSQVEEQVRDNAGELSRGALAGAIAAFEIVAGLLLAVVVLFFLLKDGREIWAWLCGLAPPAKREQMDGMGRRAWSALGGFLRGQALVAAFDAVFIGIALIVIGVPLVVPLVVLTFFAAFVPILGAIAAGVAAVLVALVSEGFFAALMVALAILAVQQIESNVFEPVIVGRTISVHPVVILLGVTAGFVLAGIIGAMVAAPIVAVGAAVLSFLREASEGERAGEEDTARVEGGSAAPAPG
jgi:putative heme transporter